MKTKSKKQTKISSTPNSVSTPTPHQESVNTIPKVVANELQTDESTNNQTISITIGFPNNEQRQYQVNLDYLVMDLKTIITASQQSQEYSCFDLYSKGSEKLPLLVQLKDVIDIQSNDRLLFLKPGTI